MKSHLLGNIAMKTITIEQARAALDLIMAGRGTEIEAGYFTMEEFITQMEHFIRTRSILVPMLLTKKE